MEYKKAYCKKSYGRKASWKDGGTESWNYESTEARKFEGQMMPLMTEDEKKDAQVLELSYDFSCRIVNCDSLTFN